MNSTKRSQTSGHRLLSRLAKPFHFKPAGVIARLMMALILMTLSACVSSIETETPIITSEEPLTSPTLASSPSPSPTSEPEDAGTIHIWLDWTPQKLEALYGVIDTFQADHPGVRFIVSYVPAEEMISSLEQAQAAGEAPTLILAPSDMGLSLAQAEILINLRDLVDNELRQSVVPLAWTQVETQSTTLGLPFTLVGNVLYRNQTLVSAPEYEVEELAATARALFLENRVGATLDFGFENTAPFLAACGARLFNQSGEFTLIASEAACWFELLTLLRPAGVSTVNTDEDRQYFINGQSGWLIDTSAVASDLASAVGLENLDIDTWPTYAKTGDDLTGYVWSENLYLLTEATFVDREITWEFMRYLISAEAQNQLGKALGPDFLPVSIDFQSDDVLQARLLEIISTGLGRPLRADFGLYQEPLQKAALDVAFRGANPTAAFNIAVDEIERALSSGNNP